MMTDESVIDWAAGWVSTENPGYRQRFLDGLRSELDQRAAARVAAHEAGKVEGIEAAARVCDEYATENAESSVRDGEAIEFQKLALEWATCSTSLAVAIRALLPAAKVRDEGSEAVDYAAEQVRRDSALLANGHRVTLPSNELKCSCDREVGDSQCARHPSCDECGHVTSHRVESCAEHAPREVAATTANDERMMDGLLRRMSQRTSRRVLTAPPIAATTAAEVAQCSGMSGMYRCSMLLGYGGEHVHWTSGYADVSPVASPQPQADASAGVDEAVKDLIEHAGDLVAIAEMCPDFADGEGYAVVYLLNEALGKLRELADGGAK